MKNTTGWQKGTIRRRKKWIICKRERLSDNQNLKLLKRSFPICRRGEEATNEFDEHSGL